VSDPAEVLRDAFAYHTWAMLTLLEGVDDLEPAQLDSRIGGTYGSILQTLTHTMDADDRYLQRLTLPEVPPYADHGTQPVAQLRERVLANDGRWNEMLDLLEKGKLHARILNRGEGYPDIDPAEGLLLNQALHHGNDHRTQVCSTLGALDLPVPDMDVWTFWAGERA
jgi:uncharacterized damage-inducible protein DinB